MGKITDPYKIALKRVKQKKDFYQHLGVYAVLGLFFFAINMITSPSEWWFVFPMLGWGVGLVIHYLTVFGVPGLYEESPEWEARAVEEELLRMKRLQNRMKQTEPAIEKELELKELQKEMSERKNWEDSELI